jgi:RNA polymerase sigma factor (sigma-70 family)
MPHVALDSVLCQARRLGVGGTSEDTPDSFLLQCFADDRDEAAFSQLVRRHGPMVLGVCRRVLRDPHAVDDVFQATFLALARRPKSIRNRTSLASWLHQVAHRIAKRVCFSTARRRAHELRSPLPAMADPHDEMSWREMCEVLDAELQALPEMFRAPLVLCYLEGLTRDEAAHQLGWTTGAVKGRLERGREMLRHRLTRRGITASAAMLGILMTQSATSAVNDSLIAATVRFALSFVTGQTKGLPPSVALLADGMIRILVATRVKSIALALLLICAVASAGVWVYRVATISIEAARSQEPIARAADPVPPKEEGSQTVRTDRFGDKLPAGTLARMGTVSLRHGSSVFYVNFLPDGKQVVSAGEDGLVRLWDVATGKEMRCFGTRGELPSLSMAVALSSDGKTLATCNGDAGVRLWDTATGQERGQVKSLKTAFALAFSPDDKTLAAASPDGLVVLWDLGKSEELRRLDGRPDLSNLDKNDRLGLFVTAKIESLVRRSNGPAGGGQGIWNERSMPHLEFSSDGKTLLAATLGFRKPTIRSTVKLWDVVTGKELRQIEEVDKTFVASAALSPNGKTVGWADGCGNVHIVEAATGKELHCLPEESPKDNLLPPLDGLSSGQMRSRFAFAPNGQTLITQTVGSEAIVVWDLESGKELRRLGKRLPPPTWPAGTGILVLPGLAVSPDGKTLASAGDGNAVTLFDLTTGQDIHPPGGHRAAITAVRYSPDGKTLTSLGGDGSLLVWEADNGKEIGMGRLPDVTLTTAFSSDGRLVASSRGDGKVRLTEAATGKELRIIPMSIKGAVRLALSPDCKTLVVGDDESSPTVWLHDVATGKETKALKPAGEKNELPSRGGLVVPFRSALPPVFSPDGKLLAAPGRGTLDIWDVVAGRQISRFELPENRAVRSAAFTPDGKSIALSLIGWLSQACNEPVIAPEDIEDETLSLWDIATGKELRLYGRKPSQHKCQPFSGAPPGFALPIPHTDPELLAISPDGRMLAHSRGREVSLWDIGSAKELGRLKGHQGVVLAGVFSPDGKTLTTTSADTTALVWDLTAQSRR